MFLHYIVKLLVFDSWVGTQETRNCFLGSVLIHLTVQSLNSVSYVLKLNRAEIRILLATYFKTKSKLHTSLCDISFEKFG